MPRAPAPEPMPKRSTSAFAYVASCRGARNRLRVTTLPPAVGRKISETVAPCEPALKRFSSVRHAVPPTPPPYVATETSVRNGVIEPPTLTVFDVDDDLP